MFSCFLFKFKNTSLYKKKPDVNNQRCDTESGIRENNFEIVYGSGHEKRALTVTIVNYDTSYRYAIIFYKM